MKINLSFNSDREKRNFKRSMVFIAILASFVCGVQVGYNGANHKIRMQRKEYAARIQKVQNKLDGIQEETGYDGYNKLESTAYTRLTTNLETK